MKKENLKIGFIEYFATGEGLTYFIFCNTDDEIPEDIPEYFKQGLKYISFNEVMSYLNIFDGELNLSNDTIRKIKIIEKQCPVIMNFLQEDAMYSFSFYQSNHINKG
jgi:hypothetical protein